MFTEIINFIEERKLADAVAALTPIYKSDDPKSAAYAGYLLGYINTRYDYDKKANLKRENSYVKIFTAIIRILMHMRYILGLKMIQTSHLII